jgi:hypothetical protein
MLAVDLALHGGEQVAGALRAQAQFFGAGGWERDGHRVSWWQALPDGRFSPIRQRGFAVNLP